MVMDSSYSSKQVLITGGLGFIGSNLAHRLLNLGARVSIVDCLNPAYGGNLFNIDGLESRLTLQIGDIRDQQLMAGLIRSHDYLFNLAAQTSHSGSMADPYTDQEINVCAQLNILEACKHFNPRIRIVHASTRQIFGRPDYLPVDECHPVRPVDINGANKFAGEAYHLIYHRAHGLRTTVLRLTNTYGPRMRIKDARQTFLGIWLKQALQGQAIRIYGDGTQSRDFNYVDDAVSALLLAGAHEQAVGRVYNLGASEAWSLADVAAIVTAQIPNASIKHVPFPQAALAIDIGNYRGDYSLIQRELGWAPQVHLTEGLHRSLEYFRQHGEHYA